MIKDFTIDKVSWHTKVVGNPESIEFTHKRFKIIIDFLQNNNLVTQTILTENEAVNDDTCIKSNDLTEKGLLLMKKCYDNWLKSIDNGKPIDNLSLFTRTLEDLT